MPRNRSSAWVAHFQEAADRWSWFDDTGDASALEEAIGLLRQAIEALPSEHRDQATYLSNLGAALGNRFEVTGNMADLDEAVALGRRAAAALPPGHPRQGMYLANLGAALQARAMASGTLSDLD